MTATESKIDYKKRFHDAIRELVLKFKMDLRPQLKGAYIYVLRYLEYEPQSPYTRTFYGYKRAAEYYEQILSDYRLIMPSTKKAAQAQTGGC
jgi:hypothetical protein